MSELWLLFALVSELWLLFAGMSELWLLFAGILPLDSECPGCAEYCVLPEHFLGGSNHHSFNKNSQKYLYSLTIIIGTCRTRAIYHAMHRANKVVISQNHGFSVSLFQCQNRCPYPMLTVPLDWALDLEHTPHSIPRFPSSPATLYSSQELPL